MLPHLTAPESGCVQDFNRYYNYGLIPSLNRNVFRHPVQEQLRNSAFIRKTNGRGKVL